MWDFYLIDKEMIPGENFELFQCRERLMWDFYHSEEQESERDRESFSAANGSCGISTNSHSARET